MLFEGGGEVTGSVISIMRPVILFPDASAWPLRSQLGTLNCEKVDFTKRRHFIGFKHEIRLCVFALRYLCALLRETTPKQLVCLFSSSVLHAKR